MAHADLTGSADLEAIAVEIFDFLWGTEQESLPTAVDHAYKRIWRQVVTGERRSGERLSDSELAAQFGLSRTPVRQALHRLAQDELIVFDPRRGFWIREYTSQDIHELYDVRAALEALAVRQAAHRIVDDELKSLLVQLDAVRASLSAGTVVRFLEHDFQFHNYLIYASGNGRLIRMLAALRSQVSIFQIRDTEYPGRMGRALDEHERVLRTLLNGQRDLAADLFAEHIAAAKDRVIADMFVRKEAGS